MDRPGLEHALVVWRIGEELLGWQASPGWRDAYERAVTSFLARLQSYTSVAALLAAYAEHRHVDDFAAREEAGSPDPASGSRLNVGIVEDAAYWRRLRQLLDVG